MNYYQYFVKKYTDQEIVTLGKEGIYARIKLAFRVSNSRAKKGADDVYYTALASSSKPSVGKTLRKYRVIDRK